jgi:hybrid cluster-associated redox disulfide protein
MIKKTNMLKETVEKYPETGMVLANAGLHCVGCHSSANETIEQGCRVHGMTDEEIDSLVEKLNSKVKEFDSMEEVQFTDKALSELKKRLDESNFEFIRIFPMYGGFDFDAVNEKHDDEIVLDKGIKIVSTESLLRFLRGVTIDFDESKNDFQAKRKGEENK